MMVLILKKMGLSDYRVRTIVEKFTRIKTMLSAIFYTVMVFVVIIGISADVYAGFSKPVPYVIIAVFLFMSFIRMYQFLLDDDYIVKTVDKTLNGDRKKRKDRKKQDVLSDDSDKVDESDQLSDDAEDEPVLLSDEAEDEPVLLSDDAEDEPVLLSDEAEDEPVLLSDDAEYSVGEQDDSESGLEEKN